jgi:hypothetical protein
VAKRAGFLLCVVAFALLAATGCGEPRGVALAVDCPLATGFLAALEMRVSHIKPLTTDVPFDDLWREIRRPADEVAVLGPEAGAGRWRIPRAYLAGQEPSRTGPPLPPISATRLERIVRHVGLDTTDPETFTVHVTRGVAVEAVGKFAVPVTFAEFAATRPDNVAVIADAVRDLVYLAPRATVVLWLRDPDRSAVYALGLDEPTLGGKLDRRELIAALNFGRE